MLKVGIVVSLLSLSLVSVPISAQQREPDAYFCYMLGVIVADADSQFIEQTYRDRTYLLNVQGENRFDGFILPGFDYPKIISMGISGLYYEAMVPFIRDSGSVISSLRDIDFHLMGCLKGLQRNPRTDSLQYTYHYKRGDTTEEIFMRLWGTYPSVDEDDFLSPGQINIEIYGDKRRKFFSYSPNKKKKNAELSAQFEKIENGLQQDLKLIKGDSTVDVYKQPIWKTKVKLKGAVNTYLKPLPNGMGAPYIYFAELYTGPSLPQAEKIFATWDENIKHNTFGSKRYNTKTRRHFKWDFLPYDDRFDPVDYSAIVKQSGYSCPDFSTEPLNRTPLFTYHLFIVKYIDEYIVGINIGNRF